MQQLLSLSPPNPPLPNQSRSKIAALVVRILARPQCRARCIGAHLASLPARGLPRFRCMAPRSPSPPDRQPHRTHAHPFLPRHALRSRTIEGLRGLARLPPYESWFKWLARAHHIEQNTASPGVSTPRLPKHLPRVPSIEQLNRAVDTVLDDASSWPARDKAIMEMLYGWRHPQRGADHARSRRHSLGQQTKQSSFAAKAKSSVTSPWATQLPKHSVSILSSAPRAWLLLGDEHPKKAKRRPDNARGTPRRSF